MLFKNAVVSFLVNIAVCTLPLTATAQSTEVTSIIKNFNGDLKHWMVIQDGQILASGAHESIPNEFGTMQHTSIDLQGRFIKPGQVDVHSNLLSEGLKLMGREVPLFDPSESWRISQRLEPELIAQAILVAQEARLKAGVTAVEDETLDPVVMAQMVRLEQAGLLKLRIWTRSYGPIRKTRTQMQSIQGFSFRFHPEKRVRYFGETYFSSSNWSDDEIEDAYLFAGTAGVLIHAYSREDAVRIAKIHARILNRRSPQALDLISGDFILDTELNEIFHSAQLKWAPRNTKLSSEAAASLLPQYEHLKLGKLEVNDAADFFVTDSPEGTKIHQIYIHGEPVFMNPDHPEDSKTKPFGDLQAFSHAPMGWAPLPIVAYDATIGFLLGGALLYYPYSEVGTTISTRVVFAPVSGRGYVDFEWAALRGERAVSPRMTFRLNTFPGFYFGYGNGTGNTSLNLIQPLRIDFLPGASYRFNSTTTLQGQLFGAAYRDLSQDQILFNSLGSDISLPGYYAGGRLDFIWDDRDNPFSTRSGGRRTIWTESWVLQGSESRFAQRLGIGAAHFIPLWAPDLVLGFRTDASMVFGSSTFLNTVTLGGQNFLRGYLANRFRGETVLSSAVELRFPIWSFISGATFGEIGRVWSTRDPTGSQVWHPSGGLGIRYGLPPDYLFKMRLDWGIGTDQNAVAFTFAEAF